MVFRGYVASISTEIDQSMVLISPRLAGLGLSTKVMLAMERGVPTATILIFDLF